MTEFLRRSDAPHKSIRCYSLLSAPVTSCSCWGAGHCCRWWQEYVTKLVLCRVWVLALSRALRRGNLPFGIGRDKCARAAEVETEWVFGLCQRCSSLFWGCCCIFGEPRADSAGFCSSESHGAERAERMAVLRVCAQGLAWAMALPCAPSRAHIQHYLHG